MVGFNMDIENAQRTIHLNVCEVDDDIAFGALDVSAPARHGIGFRLSSTEATQLADALLKAVGPGTSPHQTPNRPGK